MLSGLGEGGFVADATSLDLRFLATFDFQKLPDSGADLHRYRLLFENGEAVTERITE